MDLPPSGLGVGVKKSLDQTLRAPVPSCGAVQMWRRASGWDRSSHGSSNPEDEKWRALAKPYVRETEGSGEILSTGAGPVSLQKIITAPIGRMDRREAGRGQARSNFLSNINKKM